MGGGSPDSNPRLRAAIIKARDANMPKNNIDNAIKKGTGEIEGENYEELAYEAYASGGVALFIEVLTDNRNRAAADVRSILSKAGGEIAASGSVSRLFKRQGVIIMDGTQYTEDAVMEAALEGGAEDVNAYDGIIEVISAPENFDGVMKALQTKEFETISAGISMIADVKKELDEGGTEKILRLIEQLEEKDDVQNVFTNLSIP